MFFYGLDFHDLAPNSFMHISAFIIIYEAFLRVWPHFGLWLKGLLYQAQDYRWPTGWLRGGYGQ